MDELLSYNFEHSEQFPGKYDCIGSHIYKFSRKSKVNYIILRCVCINSNKNQGMTNKIQYICSSGERWGKQSL
jgi:hypothetical protein